MKNLLDYALDIQLFSGEGEGAVYQETGDESADAGQKISEDYDEEFSQLISGKFKEQFSKKTQAIIDKRFKETKELEAYKNKVSPVMDKLMQMYGIKEGNEEGLLESIEAEGFSAHGIEADEYSDKNESNQERLKQKIGLWIKEGESLKERFPDFDLRNEIKGNKLFSRMLLSGVPLSTAYEAIHKDEMISDAMHYTADKVRQQMVHNIEAKGRRPMENGVSSEGAVVTSVDVNSLTSQDILKILKQVENGANIKF